MLRASAAGEDQPPTFGNWGALGVDGLKAFVIGLAYTIVPYALVFATAFLAVDRLSGVVLFALVLVGIALTLIAFYAVPAAVTAFAMDGRLGAAFEMTTLRPILTDRNYLVGWVLVFVVLMGSAVVTGLMNVVPILGTIAAVFVTFYVSIAVSYIFGRSARTLARSKPATTNPTSSRRPFVPLVERPMPTFSLAFVTTRPTPASRR